MRSRFTAFAVGDPAYLLRTWHRSTRPKTLALDTDRQWYRLDIVWAERGGLLDTNGQVSFRAYYRHPDGAGQQAEVSRFVHEDGKWFYVNAN